MKLKSKKINIFQKVLAIAVLSFVFSASPIYAKPADAWLEMAGQFLKQALEKLDRQIEGIGRGAQKQSAAQTIMKQVSSIVGGGNGSSPMFITDFRDFLVTQPKNSANTYINDLISQTTSFRGSTSYEGFGGGGGGSYLRELTKLAKQSTSQSSMPKITYSGDPSKMFESGSFKNMSSYLTDANFPVSYKLFIKDAYNGKIAENMLISQTESDSGLGFIGTKKDGKTIFPGSLTKDYMANAQDVGNKILAGATSMFEIITSTVTSTVSQSLQSGIGNAQEYTTNMANEQNQAGFGSATMDMESIGSAAQSYEVISTVGPMLMGAPPL
jgi:hypothetical protein